MPDEKKHESKAMQKINALLEETTATPAPIRYVRMVDGQLMINGVDYQVVEDHKNAFDPDALNERYTDVLDKYDFIVGDWGYDQLRLRGFYKDNNHQANRDQLIGTVEDYLYEYCNFGCAYFIIQRTGAPFKPKEPTRPARRRVRHVTRNNSRRTNNSRSNNRNNTHNKPHSTTTKKRHFTVRQLDTTKSD